eukprot:CAMPEP_0174718308 /NCGR_PEP_ID=MMETSP1094-20130205/28538_1 /TAXON_ID=156173 /ORGANISM="Chrysochromulina brevifilum, Strain UTEX LB 985" /LENGTH=78 /DNA_ID=CAMNT_0015918379 /DNA_START=77 /DNA_END=316 /DNA_ORIENTATION=+
MHIQLQVCRSWSKVAAIGLSVLQLMWVTQGGPPHAEEEAQGPVCSAHKLRIRLRSSACRLSAVATSSISVMITVVKIP